MGRIIPETRPDGSEYKQYDLWRQIILLKGDENCMSGAENRSETMYKDVIPLITMPLLVQRKVDEEYCCVESPKIFCWRTSQLHLR